jgi:hypothetical protein
VTALKHRKFLAHAFFRDRAEAFLTLAGRKSMVAELHRYVRAFQMADHELEDIMFQSGDKFGLTTEAVQDRYEEMLKRVRASE